MIKKDNTAAESSLFSKENYMWMIAGVVLIVIGFLLMSGGKSDDPKVFDPNVIYSTTRITIAPIVIILGLICEIVGIMKKTGYEKEIGNN